MPPVPPTIRMVCIEEDMMDAVDFLYDAIASELCDGRETMLREGIHYLIYLQLASEM
jgi:hypothetical protein